MATEFRHVLEALGCRVTLSEMRPEYVGKTFKGTVFSFEIPKGFGFIDLTGDLDPRLFPARRVFFHISGITPRPRSNREAHLHYVGKNVVFTLAPNPRKQGRLFARNVRLESAFPLTGSEESSAANSTELNDSSSSSLDDVYADYDFLDLASFGLLNPLKDALENIITKDANKPGWRNLTLQEQNLKADAIKLGFALPLLDRAFASTNFVGEPKTYTTIEDLVEELLILQESDSAELLGTFGSNEDFRLNSWIQQAEEMGYPPAMILDALSTVAVPYEHFEDLIEQLMNMQLAREEAAQMAASANNADTEEKKVILLRKENQDLRDYFLCKICFETDAAVVFMPCGHCCSCQGCGVGQKECPVCRKKTPEFYIKSNAAVDVIIPPKEDRALVPVKEEIAALEAENKSLRTNRACHLCKEHDRTRFFLPCQHVISCGQCAQSMVWCPICKARLITTVQIYSA